MHGLGVRSSVLKQRIVLLNAEEYIELGVEEHWAEEIVCVRALW